MRAASAFFLSLLVVTASGSLLSAQSTKSNNDALFSVTVTSPTSAKDVQMRYLLIDDAGGRWPSTQAEGSHQQLSIYATSATRPLRSLKAIAYAPGCEFVTFSVDDLSTGTRQGDFHCQELPLTQLQGKIPPTPGQQLAVQSMYVVRWAGKFFGVSGISLSPLSLAQANVESDGSFTLEVPDFTYDPLWSSLSSNASLMFFLVDRNTGQRIASLRPPPPLAARDGNLRVAASYPQITFTLRQNQIAKAGKSTP